MDRNHELKVQIANNIKREMKRLGYTQLALSEKSGISKSTISDYLNSKTLANPANIQKIADALNVKKSDLDPSFKKESEPSTLAAHLEGQDYTQEELDKILEFAEMVRKSRDK
ncbi:transcriptional regulator [Staphylococcus condimenti]|uniref:helix-turn-helix domain-containing protein n=1 Tax=Staphylococcus condimenti TaxID=70255 RepID=UPI0009474224|nr:helix-turn-helix transcriptional regulator [Staphylococcus condimenti]APR61457.1 transcriptional regulator [Staphylococcus condimenti]MDK8645258.1 helix-turn-helix transcriptional regulator [Staphylococcus condimenti]